MRVLGLWLLLGAWTGAWAQGTVPVFQVETGHGVLTLAGNAPKAARTTMLRTVLAPVNLEFATAQGMVTLDAAGNAAQVAESPLFKGYGGAADGQYGDALLRAAVTAPEGWHTLLSAPKVEPVTVLVPAGDGYVLTDRPTGRRLGVVDSGWLEHAVMARLPKAMGQLVIAYARNTTYYADSDATDCCTWGTHGVDAGTGASFVLSTFLDNAPAIVTDSDLQPLTQQLAEFLLDPLHNPMLYGRDAGNAGNVVPAWRRPVGDTSCAGAGVASDYYLLEPTETNRRINLPTSPAYVEQAGGRAWHMENVALPAWYDGRFAGSGQAYSFPSAEALPARAMPCADARHSYHDDDAGSVVPRAEPAPNTDHAGHALIGYWTGHGSGPKAFTLPKISPQWDVVIVAFASPAEHGALRFAPPEGMSDAQFKANVTALQKQGRKVLISLGGGGAYFHLDNAGDTARFVTSVEQIVSTYGFDGVDLDFESPSLALAPGDTDYRHPTTTSTMQTIGALHTLHDHFGKGFMISLVPEGTQIPGGLPSYGGQFGSYLPIAYGIRDILSFVDVQDYNTPPLEGLDGRIYQVGGVDYDAAMTELLLQGFDAGGHAGERFGPLPARKVAVGFLAGYTTAGHMQQAMRWLMTGKAPAGTTYKLQKPGGYPQLLGAMLWTINADRHDDYAISNTVGPQLHAAAR